METKFSFKKFKALISHRDLTRSGDILEYLHHAPVVLQRPSDKQRIARLGLVNIMSKRNARPGVSVVPEYTGIKMESDVFGKSYIVPDVAVMENNHLYAVGLIITADTDLTEFHYKVAAITSSGCRFIYIVDLENQYLDIYDAYKNVRSREQFEFGEISRSDSKLFNDYLNPFAV